MARRGGSCLVLAVLGCLGFGPRLRAQTTYGYTGSAQSYTVPAGISLIRVKIWAGGGAANGNISGSYGTGGGAGFVQADIPVTPGQTFSVVVGQGGCGWNSTEGYGGSTYPDAGNSYYGGGGGGRSEFSGSGVDLIAGGGGGGGYQFDGPAGQGGPGGPNGSAGGSSPNNQGGGGGTQSSGGSGGSGDCSSGNAGGFESGGAGNGANIPGGGGGGGYYGGGSGGGGLTGTGDSGGGGGGGSNLVSGSGLANVINAGGSGSTPGGASDANWLSSGCSNLGNYGAGQGGTNATYRAGNGEIVIVALQTAPQITSALSYSANQGQYGSYQITATGSPTSYSAANLPAGMSLNTSNGQITGYFSAGGTTNSTISATNSYGTTSATLTWNITAASIVPSASVSPSSLYLSQSVTLTRAGTCNFGVWLTQGTIWRPDGGHDVLGNQGLGSQTYTPAAGTGTYWWQFRLVDNYGNFQDEWISFLVTSPNVAAPTSFSTYLQGSDFVVINWSGASAQAGISHYNVFRNGVFIGTSASAGATDSGPLNGSTTYVYTVQTVDTQGNVSPLSSSYSVTTLGDLELFTPLL